ncbi:hypothetical protein ACIRVK_29790 [Streptomyces sp. NPDC101152]|uniref:hypothetical protein n=1 Tax=Streptomyces sp. NPDC101152 TaxID=3366116 RepID=UPI00381AB874
MVFFQLVGAVVALGAQHLFQSRYGTLGFLCLFLLGAGFRARNTACLSAGAVIFVLLMTQA